MLTFYTTRRHAYTLKIFLRDWAGPRLRARVRVTPYESLRRPPKSPGDTAVFTDLERLTDSQLDAATIIAAAAAPRIVNDPRRTLRRFALLEAMSRSGRNRFRAFRAGEPIDEMLRFPVFLKREDEHDGPLFDLLHDADQLAWALTQADRQGEPIDRLLVIEFCETAGSDGFYRKYSSFRFGQKIIPAHVVFDSHWNAKTGFVPGDDLFAEQTRFLETNPHADETMAIFEEAAIDYGRIDYSFLDGTIQVWEINTNPVLIMPRKQYPQAYVPLREALALEIEEALLQLAG
ncbi:MAG: hypothetical protein AAGE01_01120 [Pseudomonadota bacterium]